jgi:Fur family ferric uptake transcriptional regulator
MSYFLLKSTTFFVLVANATSFVPVLLHPTQKYATMNKIIKRVWISLMARSDGYNTKTRQLILDYLINNRQHAVSASNILEHLEAQGASPNPTTVYRYLDKLAGEQRIMKYVADKGEKAVFQYVDEGRHCREHLHLKCVQCGRIYHLDCHFMDEVRAHLMAEHGFTLQCEGSVLYGLCRHCAQKAEQSDSAGQTAQKCACCVDTDKKP